MTKLSFNDTVRIVLNSFEEGLIDKLGAIQMIEDAAHNQCVDCEDLHNCLSTIQRAMEETVEGIMEGTFSHPLDFISINEALQMNEDKDIIFPCEDGHVIGVFQENQAMALKYK